jgi:hypothetical protein
MLATTYGKTIDLNASISALSETYNEYTIKRKTIIENCKFGAHLFRPDYNEALLVCEALRIFIREIAPVRKLKRKK